MTDKPASHDDENAGEEEGAEANVFEKLASAPESQDSLATDGPKVLAECDGRLFLVRHQIQSLGEILEVTNEDMIDGIQLGGLGIVLTRLAKEIEEIQDRLQDILARPFAE